jgi:small subunit ribosomal protein S20
MANIKSAEKRILVAERNRQRNRAATSDLRTSIKRFRTAVAAGDKDAAAKLLREAHATIDKSAKKGVIHRGAASRYKSRLAQAHGRMGAGPSA